MVEIMSEVPKTPQQVKEGIAFVRPYLDPAFQLQRAGGEVVDMAAA